MIHHQNNQNKKQNQKIQRARLTSLTLSFKQVEMEMIFSGFEDEKWLPMEGGCLGIEILTGEWPENTRKAGGGGLAV